MRSPLALLLSLPIWLYRKVISPLTPPTCRFRPTCSSYALAALREHGAVRGSWLAFRRLCRCHPFCEPRWDPVPRKPAPPEARTPEAQTPEASQPEASQPQTRQAQPDPERPRANADKEPPASHRN